VHIQNAPARTGKQKWLAMLGLGMGVFMATLDASIVNISLPTLAREFNTSFATVIWVALAYVLVLTSLMLSVARLGDMYDKKKLYLLGVALFTAASLLCGLAPGVGWLIAFRALQGIGAALTQALGVALVAETFPANERGRALGVIGSTVSVGIAVGPPVGGLLIGLAGWPSIFLVNVPVGLLTLLVVRAFVPSSTPREGQRFDMIGAGILFFTLSSYALGMTLGQQRGFGEPLTGGLLLAAVLGLAIFLFVESRRSEPMIDLRMFRNVLFSLNLLMGFLVFVVMAGAYVMPFFLELVIGLSTQQVGLLMMANPIAMGLIAPLAGLLADRFGPRGISLVGLVVIIAGCLTISTLDQNTTPLGFIARLLPFGIGMGLFQSPNNSAIIGSAPRERMGVASGLLSLARTLGQTTGMPLMGALFALLAISFANLPPGTDATTAPPAALVAGITGAYRIAAFIILAALGMAWVALGIDNRRRQIALQAKGDV
jgi:EmrB/QacA subfamily drug resistance transporter